MRISIRAMGQEIRKPFNRPNVFLQSMPVAKIIALAKPRESMYSVSCLPSRSRSLRNRPKTVVTEANGSSTPAASQRRGVEGSQSLLTAIHEVTSPALACPLLWGTVRTTEPVKVGR